jgi:hypothetical protein
VLFDVYLLNPNGADDPVEALRAGPQRGELVIRRWSYHMPDKSLCAMLYRPGTKEEMLQPLRYVQFIGMSDKGMVIEGTATWAERTTHKSRRHDYKQRWLCKQPGAAAVLNTEKLLKRSAANLKKIMASGFDPADDDRTD